MITYCTAAGATPERSSAAAIAAPPSLVAGKSFRLPSSRPIGVRAPPTITLVMPSSSAPLPERPFTGQTTGMATTTGIGGIGIRRVDHVCSAVADLDAAIDFYSTTFGMRCTHRETNAEQGVAEAMLQVGDEPG